MKNSIAKTSKNEKCPKNFFYLQTKPTTMSLLDQDEVAGNEEISTATFGYMLKAAKWMQFVAIAGFIFIGIFAVIILAIPELMLADGLSMPGNAYSTGIIIGFIVALLITFFPNLFLYQSAINFNRYARDINSFNLEVGFKKLHSLFLYVGIIVIIYFAFFILAFIVQGL